MGSNIRVAKTKTLISFAIIAKLISVFVFAYAKAGFLIRGSLDSICSDCNNYVCNCDDALIISDVFDRETIYDD